MVSECILTKGSRDKRMLPRCNKHTKNLVASETPQRDEPIS